MKPLWGKYRAVVLDNCDPLLIGRLQVSAPAIGAAVLNWALPCVPYAPIEAGFAVPPIGTAVWIEFEGGDPNAPIWTGRFWREGDERPRSVGASE